MNNRAQVTIFIIIAIIIVGVIVGYFMLRNQTTIQTFPARFQPIETSYQDCISQKLEEGKTILGEQAGYITLPRFEPGSDYRPFSSQLAFQNQAVPYWYYVSGNNILKEQVPSKADMQKQLEVYLEENLDCDFSSFGEQGYIVQVSKPNVKVTINDLDIIADVSSELYVVRENDSARQTERTVKIDSKLGSFYKDAIKIYNSEKQSAFMEDYAVDILRNYAPVDGVDITCSPKIWLKKDIDLTLKQAIEANVGAIKTTGDYYQTNNINDKYFIQNIQTDNSVNFLYSQDWPTRIEVWNAKDGILMAEPVGLQQGLGILGFCYVPYHFVYDLNYPVLVQLYSGTELFQFPVAVVIEKNKQRQALNGSAIENSVPELCNHMNQDITVNTFNNLLEPVSADISFECLGASCDVGKSVIEDNFSATFTGKFPQCANGIITAKADGYADSSTLFSTNQDGVVDIVLEKLHNVSISLRVEDRYTDDFAVITFTGKDVRTVVWPEQDSVQLSEGEYNLSVSVYRNSSITIPAVNTKQCSEVPQSGLAGIFGATTEKCFDINIPSETVSNSLAAGGKGIEYFTEDMLMKKMQINVGSLGVPTTLEALQKSYMQLDVSPVYVTFNE
jgi:hypothetical protein